MDENLRVKPFSCITVKHDILFVVFLSYRLSIASKIMAKYGYKEGQGLGKSEQGMSTALFVEKTSKRGGKIIHERDLPKGSLWLIYILCNVTFSLSVFTSLCFALILLLQLWIYFVELVEQDQPTHMCSLIFLCNLPCPIFKSLPHNPDF